MKLKKKRKIKMPNIRTASNKEGNKTYLFYCPGCDEYHGFKTPPWTWNGDVDKPTVRASLLTKAKHRGLVCHLFITDGKIRYLNDCTHDLAGKTVDMGEGWLKDEKKEEEKPKNKVGNT